MERTTTYEKDGTTYIEFKPTWASMLPALIAVLRDGTIEGQRMAEGELRRMADAADRYNNLCDADGEVQI